MQRIPPYSYLVKYIYDAHQNQKNQGRDAQNESQKCDGQVQLSGSKFLVDQLCHAINVHSEYDGIIKKPHGNRQQHQCGRA